MVAVIAADDLMPTARSHVAHILNVPDDTRSVEEAMVAASVRPDTHPVQVATSAAKMVSEQHIDDDLPLWSSQNWRSSRDALAQGRPQILRNDRGIAIKQVSASSTAVALTVR